MAGAVVISTCVEAASVL